MVSEVAEIHPDLAFDYVVARRDRMDRAARPGVARQLLPTLALRSIDPAMVGKLEAFAERHIAPSSRRSSDNAIAQVKMRSTFARDRLGASIAGSRRRRSEPPSSCRLRPIRLRAGQADRLASASHRGGDLP
jgi:aminopeptidase N